METPQDVPEGIASPEDRIAITAGASTPQWLLEAVRARVEALAGGQAQGAT